MAKIICLAQSKGGTGKTSSALNIGAALIEKGYRVLLCDLDQQANLTVSLSVNPLEFSQSNMRHLLTETQLPARNLIIATQEGLDLIPAHIDLAMVEYKMPSLARERILAQKLAPLQSDYDFILLDTAPSLGIATFNALTACDYVLIPSQPEPLCVYVLYSLINETLQSVQIASNPALKLIGIFITFYDARVKGHREIEKQLREQWTDQILTTIIKRRPTMLETSMEGRSVLSVRSNSELAHEYRMLTQEVLDRVSQ